LNQDAFTPSPGQRPARIPGRLLAVGITLAVLILVGGIFGFIAWGAADARAWLATRFAEARRDPRAAMSTAGDEEAREAWSLVAASRGESLPWLTESQGGGTPWLDMRTDRCMNPTLLGTWGTRPLGILLREHTVRGTLTITVEGISAQRRCTCSGSEDDPCRLE
jgi:hypothetical protein